MVAALETVPQGVGGTGLKWPDGAPGFSALSAPQKGTQLQDLWEVGQAHSDSREEWGL